MKKFSIFFILVFVLSLFYACDKKENVKSQFSEITKTFYNGVSQDGKMNASICVGEREDPYIIDGKHGVNVEFSLMVVYMFFSLDVSFIEVELFMNESKETIKLEYNPLNNTYMADLGYSLKEGVYSLKYLSSEIEFKQGNLNFKVGFDEAIDKSFNTLGAKVDSYYSGNIFQAECYLKILSKPDENFEELYWIFTIVGVNGERNNVIINIKNGEIILLN